jgi:hypothetical protein
MDHGVEEVYFIIECAKIEQHGFCRVKAFLSFY